MLYNIIEYKYKLKLINLLTIESAGLKQVGNDFTHITHISHLQEVQEQEDEIFNTPRKNNEKNNEKNNDKNTEKNNDKDTEKNNDKKVVNIDILAKINNSTIDEKEINLESKQHSPTQTKIRSPEKKDNKDKDNSISKSPERKENKDKENSVLKSPERKESSIGKSPERNQKETNSHSKKEEAVTKSPTKISSKDSKDGNGHDNKEDKEDKDEYHNTNNDNVLKTEGKKHEDKDNVSSPVKDDKVVDNFKDDNLNNEIIINDNHETNKKHTEEYNEDFID